MAIKDSAPMHDHVKLRVLHADLLYQIAITEIENATSAAIAENELTNFYQDLIC
ncbi:MAG: hypothetical protein AAF992_08200 [Bacteroidota bacterium]